MRIGLVTSAPEHPLLAAAMALLTPHHDVCVLDPAHAGTTGLEGPPADVYLLKARTPRALALARYLEERGAPVLNTASATELCQDRTAMAAVARGAGLPFARTRSVASLGRLLAEGGPGQPVVIKSRHSRRGDLVALVADRAALCALEPEWRDEPVVVQPFTPNNGWDHKVWVIDGQVFAALRRSELAAEPPGTTPLAGEELPPGWAALALRVGDVFALDVYGVDIIDAGGGAPRIVDINAFPGVRGQAGAPEALAALALRTATEAIEAVRERRRAAVPVRPGAWTGPMPGASPTMPE
ncbi:ATP-grasp domain-containing protein [Streptomyces montanisoli]|uniref:Alpha-L-glutamate ligase n=1 Tax=Streptomyces montanisoli TaxID=2798581 RepID=A0A940MH64_9ACTN|nr:alpha-L-glutamate ligase [Streptomyces montanisoli]MBP0460768.1 alpha-L-glutamate ligase [Streptomyces montanisoli]